MGNLIVILVILAILSGAVAKVYIDKKNGVACSGCPSAPKGGFKKGQTCQCPSDDLIHLDE